MNPYPQMDADSRRWPRHRFGECRQRGRQLLDVGAGDAVQLPGEHAARNVYATDPPSHSCVGSGTNVIPSSRIVTSQPAGILARRNRSSRISSLKPFEGTFSKTRTLDWSSVMPSPD